MITGFIGDIHGCDGALREVLGLVEGRVDRLVFLGDYVDRGPNSREVIDTLISIEARGFPEVVFLAGNHDLAFRNALERDDSLDEYLLLGGAATIRSYVDAPYSDVLSRLRRAVPQRHRDFLAQLRATWSDGAVLGVHDPRDIAPTSDYVVSGHAVQADLVPTINATHAQIDTGCGTSGFGRLTCFTWPDKSWVQSSLIALRPAVFDGRSE